MRVVTTAEIRHLEHITVERGHATWVGLMEQAGWSVAQIALSLLGDARGKAVLVLVGAGNNGGDGLVVARHLHDAGAQVSLYLWRRDHPTNDPNWQRCRQRAIAEYTAATDPQQQTLRALVAPAVLIVDGLLGIGITRPVSDDLAAIVQVVNARPRSTRLLAIDVPTGINADTGTVAGVALRADATAVAGLYKRGLLLYPGRSYAGALHLASLDLLTDEMENDTMSETLSGGELRALLPARPDDSHKGTYGKTLVIAGSYNYPGAAVLATAGAARAGAGLVTLAAPRGVLALTTGTRLPEVTLLPLAEAGSNPSPDALKEMFAKLNDYHAILIGPGLGTEDETRTFLLRVLGVSTPRTVRRVGFRTAEEEPSDSSSARPTLPPLVLDADALNILAAMDDWQPKLPPNGCVLTPHPGEMRRLLAVDELPADPVQVASDAARDWQQVVVLKGATTVIANPEGRTVLHSAGNAALATAGTGDVLAGVIAALLAQGLSHFDAAVLGVHLHGMAGALVRDELGTMGALASDLVPRLPFVVQQLLADEAED